MSNLRLIIFSDLHYTDEEQNWEKKRKLVEQAEPILEKLIEKINNGNMPDGVYFDVLVDKNNLEVEEKHIRI